MINIITQLKAEITNRVITDKESLESFRLDFISKKGKIAHLFAQFKLLSTAEKKNMSPTLNALKNEAEKKFTSAAQQIKHQNTCPAPIIDGTLPAIGNGIGSLHPLRIVQNKIIALLKHMGFNLTEGPEIVGDWHNFEALNFSVNHSARSTHDTFFIQRNPDWLLRTHTTSAQISTCTSQAPPIRSIALGRAFRNETISGRSHCFFHQIDGMYVDTHVTFCDLKATIAHFIHALFGSTSQLRFRASYFPFTEPSAEVDMSCNLCQGSGCTVCKHSGWVEILGAGMIDPAVLTNCNIDPAQYSGFAFGMGIERIAMLLYQIDDLRLFSENHLDFLRQFTACLHLTGDSNESF